MDIYVVHPSLTRKDFLESYDFSKCFTRVDPDGAFSELDVAVALILHEGNLSAAAKLLGRSRSRLVTFIARNDLLTDLQGDLEEAFLDDIEFLHRAAALGGDVGTQRFFLTTRGRDRGFVQRTELTGKGGGPIQHETSAIEKLTGLIDGIAERS